MKIVREIRDAVVDGSISLSSILRKAKILAASLGNQEFRRWVDCELNGYSGNDELPSYRKLNSQVLGNFSGPFGDMVTGYPLPVSFMPDLMKKMAEAVRFGQPVKQVESLAGSERATFRLPWPTEAVLLLRDKIQLSGGFVLVEIYRPIGNAQLEGILDSVRNRLLDFLLALQEIEPEVLDSEEALTKISGETVSQVFNVTIHGDNNVLASGAQIKQEVTQNIELHDKRALMNYLKKLGIDDGDLQALDKAIEKDGPPTQRRLGGKVTEWLGKMAGKAVDGTWKTIAAVAPTLVTKAISQYYGWD